MLQGLDYDLSFVCHSFGRLGVSIRKVSNVLLYLLVYDSALCLVVLSLLYLILVIWDL